MRGLPGMPVNARNPLPDFQPSARAVLPATNSRFTGMPFDVRWLPQQTHRRLRKGFAVDNNPAASNLLRIVSR